MLATRVKTLYTNRTEIALFMYEQNLVFAPAQNLSGIVWAGSLRFNLLDSAFSQRCRGLSLKKAKMV